MFPVFPVGFLSDICVAKEDVKFLNNIKSSCTHHIRMNEDNSRYLRGDNYFGNLSIIAAPNLFNISKYQKNIEVKFIAFLVVQ